MRPVVQMLLRTEVASEEGRAFAVSAVLDWAAKKWGGLVPTAAWERTEFEHDEPGLKLGAIHVPERGLWGFRVEHPDSGVPGRTWMVEVVIASTESGFDLVGARSQCSATGDIPFTSPAFIRSWIDRLALRDGGRTITALPWDVDDASTASLVRLLCDADRQLPALVLSQLTSGGYVIDPDRLARRTAGLAHVVRLATPQAAALTSALGREQAVYNGAVRTYLPGFGQPSDTRTHFNVLPARVTSWPSLEGTGPGAFLEFLVAQMHRYSVGTPARLEQLPSYVQLRTFRAERERSLQLERLDALQKDLASRASDDSGATIQLLTAQLEERNLELDLLRLEKEKAEKDAADASLLFDEQAAELAAAQEERDTLRATNESLFAGLKRLKEARGDVVVPPITYAEIPSWVEETLSDRLTLLSRARRSLKDAVFQDVALVVNCLLLLAKEYWTLRTAETDKHAAAKLAFESKMQEIGVDEAASITANRRGEVEEQYTVNYTIGHKSKQVLERHLRGGTNTKDDRFCMRIYFFWDGERQRVVIGDLPGHLDTRAS